MFDVEVFKDDIVRTGGIGSIGGSKGIEQSSTSDTSSPIVEIVSGGDPRRSFKKLLEGHKVKAEEDDNELSMDEQFLQFEEYIYNAGVYQNIVNAYEYLVKVFRSLDMSDDVIGNTGVEKDHLWGILGNAQKAPHFSFIGDDEVQTGGYRIPFNIRWIEIQNANPVRRHILRKLFNNKKIPAALMDSSQEFIPNENRPNITERRLPRLVSPLRTLERISQLDFQFERSTPGDLELTDEDYERGFSGKVLWRVILESDSIRIAETPYYGMTATGNLHLEFFIQWPMRYALWGTSAENVADFVPSMFTKLVGQYAHFHCVGGWEPAGRLTLMDSISEKAKTDVTSGRITARPRVNDDNYAIIANGGIIKLDPVDNSAQYTQLMKDAYREDVSDIDFGILPRNYPILLDWANDKFTYINAEKNLTIVDLMGCIPLDDITIYRLLNSHPDEYDSFLSHVHNIATDNSLYDQEKVINLTAKYDSIFQLIDECQSNDNNLAMADYMKAERFLDTERLEDMRKEVGRVIRAARVYLEGHDIAFSTKITEMYVKFDALTKYVENYRTYAENYMQSVKDHTVIPSLPDSVSLPNLPGLESLMPHQAKADQALEKDPTSVFLNASPGAGKTIMLIIDVLRRMERGEIKRPLIITPRALVREFITEINRISQGKINAVPIRQITLDRLVGQFEIDTGTLAKMFRRYPINTLFISDYFFLKGTRDLDTGTRKEWSIYGEEWTHFRTNVEFLKNIGFDYIAQDESHKVKNPGTELMQAATTMMCNAKYRRSSSGTLVTNVATDLVGQAAQHNPYIFGSKEQFNKRYGETFKGGNVESWKPGFGEQIDDDMRPYSLKINVRRADFAYQLPRVEERLFYVEMTDAQQDFYEKFLQRVIMEIMEDPKIQKMIQDDDPENEGKLEAAFRKGVAPVEIYMNAPESNGAFANLEDISEEDLISPKVERVDELITAHFEGGEVQGTNIEKSPNKIIILGYNKAVATHVRKHSQYRDESLLYTQGRDDVLLKFRSDNEFRIMFADEGTIQEGFNFQIADHMVRLQTLWTPGGHEQALSRVLRPDPRGEYNRERIQYSWILTTGSLEIAKTAKLIHKLVSKMEVDEAKNPDWREANIVSPGNISMNPMTFLTYDTVDSLRPYYETYADLKQFEDEQFAKSNDKLAKEIEKKTGKKIRRVYDERLEREVPDKMQLRKLAMVKVKPSKDLEGTETSPYVPWEPGALVVDEHNIGLTPVVLYEDEPGDEYNIASEDLDEEEEEGQEVVQLQVGDVVMTEVGTGTVTNVFKNHCYVNIAAYDVIYSFTKNILMVPSSTKGARKLRKVMQKEIDGEIPLKLPYLEEWMEPKDLKDRERYIDAPGEGIGAGDEPEEDIPTEDDGAEVEPDPDSTPLDDRAVGIYPGTVNGFPALVSYVDDPDTKELRKMGWKFVPSFVSIQIRTYPGMQRYMSRLQEEFEINPSIINEFLELGRIMRGARQRLDDARNLDQIELRDFLRLRFRPIKEATELRPYPVVVDNALYMNVNVRQHNRGRIARLKRIRGIPGVGSYDDIPGMILKFFRNKSAMTKELRDVSKAITVTNYDEAIDMIGDITFRRKRKDK